MFTVAATTWVQASTATTLPRTLSPIRGRGVRAPTQVEVLKVAKDSSRNSKPLAPTVANMNDMPAPPTVAGVLRGTLRPRGGATGGGEPATAYHPRQIQERMGAQRRIQVKLPGAQSPEAGATQSNGRILPATKGSRQNFFSGRTSYL